MSRPPSPIDRPVLVVGGGFSGLVAARRLASAGLPVTLLEAGDRLGGQVRTVWLDGAPVDVGAEAFHLAAPTVLPLLTDLGLADSLVRAHQGSSWLALPQGLRRLPAGIGPAGPSRLRPVLTSRTLGPLALARAGLEPLAARLRSTPDLGPGRDISVASFTTARFGRGVTDTFIDPLLGSLHAGDVRRLSLRACAPTLVPAARDGRSLLRRRPPAPAGASQPPRPGATGGAVPAIAFASWSTGLETVIDALARDCLAAGVTVRLDTAVRDLDPVDGTVGLVGGERLAASAVVLAVPGRVSGTLLGEQDLTAIETATVATVLLGFARSDLAAVPAFAGTGILVPSRAGSLLKAATFLGTKWPHLAHGGTFWVRVSVGRAGQDRHSDLTDPELIRALLTDLRALTGVRAEPHTTHVHRWPDALPQLTVGHPDRVAAVRDRLGAVALPIVLAGASYDGIGLASCIGSATAAADRVRTLLAL